MIKIRSGIGYDIHRLVPGDGLMLGGVKVSSDLKAEAHSDGDVLVHSLIDALLGAMGQPDIGELFPDSDPAYKGADSLKLLAHVMGLAEERGYRLGNLDATIIAQMPKMAPHIQTMRGNIARVLNADVGQVNVKATTEEGLGFSGAGEGIAAHAVVLMLSNG